MATCAKRIIENEKPVVPLREFFKTVLQNGSIKGILIPAWLPVGNRIMPMLITDETGLDHADPIAPAFPLNGARQVSRLTRKPMGQKIAVVLRPCEIRAFVELVKLNQGHMEEVLIIGIDCLGAFTNKNYRKFLATCDSPSNATHLFFNAMISGDNTTVNDIPIASACRACTDPIPHGADIRIMIVKDKEGAGFIIRGQTAGGNEFLELSKTGETTIGNPVVTVHMDQRESFRKEMIARTTKATDSVEKLAAYFADCVNCYNCRVACPVCYCKECVFVTDSFIHDPFQYLQWANRKGRLKMPTDTLFFHLTRLAHMGAACVGCGQCSNACPNDIPVMELFAGVAENIQAAFDYVPGKSVNDKPPLSAFRENEFEEIVGIN